MQNGITNNERSLSRCVGWSLIATIATGILISIFISAGIDVNLSADIAKTAENMLVAEERLRAKSYAALFVFMLQSFTMVGFFVLLRNHGTVLAMWFFVVGASAAVLSLLGSVYAMNAALIAGNSAFEIIADSSQRLLLTGLQVTSDYTSFHLSLVLSSAANVGVFYLFLTSGLIPRLISVWGIFASLFVTIALVSRDFIPILGHNVITGAFMISNLIALLALGFYLGIKGVRLP